MSVCHQNRVLTILYMIDEMGVPEKFLSLLAWSVAGHRYLYWSVPRWSSVTAGCGHKWSAQVPLTRQTILCPRQTTRKHFPAGSCLSTHFFGSRNRPACADKTTVSNSVENQVFQPFIFKFKIFGSLAYMHNRSTDFDK